MKALSSERQELIDGLVAETTLGGITAAWREKDEHRNKVLPLETK